LGFHAKACGYKNNFLLATCHYLVSQQELGNEKNMVGRAHPTFSGQENPEP
jgi:hypothetical protein